jgi:PBP1b-binding outer membrane lipoprotein LpoB
MMKKGGENIMKKISVIIVALAIVAIFAFAGCQQEAPKPAVQSAVTSTATTTAPAAAPAAAPVKK